MRKVNMMKWTFLVVGPQVWGKGLTVQEAAINCAKESRSRSTPVSVVLILGDDMAHIAGIGQIVRHEDSVRFDLIKAIKVGALISSMPHNLHIHGLWPLVLE